MHYRAFIGSDKLQILFDERSTSPLLPDFPDCYPCNKYLSDAICYNVQCMRLLINSVEFFEDDLGKQYCSVACIPAETSSNHFYQRRAVVPPEPDRPPPFPPSPPPSPPIDVDEEAPENELMNESLWHHSSDMDNVWDFLFDE